LLDVGGIRGAVKAEDLFKQNIYKHLILVKTDHSSVSVKNQKSLIQTREKTAKEDMKVHTHEIFYVKELHNPQKQM